MSAAGAPWRPCSYRNANLHDAVRSLVTLYREAATRRTLVKGGRAATASTTEKVPRIAAGIAVAPSMPRPGLVLMCCTNFRKACGRSTLWCSPTCRRTFHLPQRRARHGQWAAGGGEPGHVSRRVKKGLSRDQWRTVIARLEEVQLSQMPTHEDENVGVDGAQWIVEGVAMGGTTSWTAGAAPTALSQSEGFFSTWRA